MRRVPQGRGVVVVTLVVFLVFLLGTPPVGATGGRNVTVTPSVGLTDGEGVTVTGSGFISGSTVTVTICSPNVVSTSPQTAFFASCYFSDFTNVNPDANGGFAVVLPVHTSGTLLGGGPAPRCGVVPADCEIVAANFDNGQFASAPITFGFGTPTNVSALASSTPQAAAVNTAFATQLQAKVTNVNGNAVPGVTVTFAAPTSGPSGSFAGGLDTATTDANGLATAPVFTANGTPGSYTVSASVAGVTNPASFAMTNVPDQADLSVHLRAQTSVASGSTIVYTATVTNKGPAPAKNLVTVLVVPTAVVVSSVNNGGVKFLGALIWSQRTLSPGQSTSFSAAGVVLARPGGFLVGIDAAFSQTPDPRPFDNLAFALTAVT